MVTVSPKLGIVRNSIGRIIGCVRKFGEELVFQKASHDVNLGWYLTRYWAREMFPVPSIETAPLFIGENGEELPGAWE